ncbi:hypothetical protein RUND412_010834, partial [Rhizina undulata]
ERWGRHQWERRQVGEEHRSGQHQKEEGHHWGWHQMEPRCQLGYHFPGAVEGFQNFQ